MKTLVLRHERCPGCALCEVICGLAHFKETNPKKAAIHHQSGSMVLPGNSSAGIAKAYPAMQGIS